MRRIKQLSAQLLCVLGQHDFELIGMTFGFGPAGGIRTLACRRCGREHVRSS